MKKVLSKGFTLVELMFVVSIIGLLAVIGVAAYQNAYKTVLARCIHQDLRRAEQAVKLYICENFRLPPKTGMGEHFIHPELAPYFPRGWPSTSLLGVEWKWCYFPEPETTYFQVWMDGPLEDDPSLRAALQLCDEQMDDGDLSHGALKIGNQGVLWYAIDSERYWQ